MAGREGHWSIPTHRGDVWALLAVNNNLDGDRPPSTSDDRDDGYMKGSVWFDLVNRTEWVCIDPLKSNAVWVQRAGGAAGTPPALDDAALDELKAELARYREAFNQLSDVVTAMSAKLDALDTGFRQRPPA